MKNPQYVPSTQTKHPDPVVTRQAQEPSSRELLLGQITLVLLFVIAILLRSMA